MDYCNCYVKTNIKCATCDKLFKTPSTKEEQILELKKLIKQNVQDNIIYKMEIQELQDEIEYKEENNYNCLSDPDCLISRASPLSDDLYTTKSADLSSSSSSSDLENE
jgi:hypothetical protein